MYIDVSTYYIYIYIHYKNKFYIQTIHGGTNPWQQPPLLPPPLRAQCTLELHLFTTDAHWFGDVVLQHHHIFDGGEGKG